MKFQVFVIFTFALICSLSMAAEEAKPAEQKGKRAILAPAPLAYASPYVASPYAAYPYAYSAPYAAYASPVAAPLVAAPYSRAYAPVAYYG